MINPGLHKYLTSEGYSELREIEGRGICGIIKMIFTTGLAYGIDEIGLKGRYCFHSTAEAREALNNWDGKQDPSGNWLKHKGGREYRNENYKVET